MHTHNISQRLRHAPYAMAVNLLLLYVCYMVCRAVMLFENWDLFADNLTSATFMNILRGGLRFDTSAIIYSNLPYVLIVLLPLHYMQTSVMQKVAKAVYVTVNSLFIIVNLMDCVYFAFSQRRATLMIFQEFGMNTNNASIIAHEALSHWYLVLLAILMIYLLYRLYVPTIYPKAAPRGYFYIYRSICFVICAPILFLGMRGGWIVKGNKPLSVGEAHQYVTKAVQTGLVMNTTFSMIRLSMRNRQAIPQFFESEGDAERLAPFVHTPADTVMPNNKNVLVVVIEGFSQEFVGALSNGEKESDTPFFDSLYLKSASWTHSIANGWLSLDAIPSIQASIPKMYDSYVYSQYSLNNTPGIARELRNTGYTTAYFHGGENSTLGFRAASKSTGIERYYGRDEYDRWPGSNGKADFDGTWAIWDEEFLQFTAATLDTLAQPFYATVFTATTHHPYALPKRYEHLRRDTDSHPIYGCVRYTDNALRLFFETISRQKWFENSIIIVTADHCFREIQNQAYNNDLGRFLIPILVYTPDGCVPAGKRQGVVQQIDIMPTVLNAVGYPHPYMSLGIDILNTPASDTWGIIYQDFPQLISGSYILQLDGFKPTGLYDIDRDPQLKNNLIKSPQLSDVVTAMQDKLKAVLQVYDTHMKADNLIIEK